MAKKDKNSAALSWDDLVFESRNKDYGSYDLRKKFRKYLLIGFLISLFAVTSGVAVPYIKAITRKVEKQVVLEETTVEMADVNAEDESLVAPPPPPPAAAMEQQVKYAAPVIVDTVTEEVTMAIVDDVKATVTNEPVPETIEVAVEEEAAPVIEEEEPPFMFVEEDATFQGGDLNTFRDWVQQNLVYPPLAVENGIFGRVTVQFVVDSRGDVTDVTIVRGVDPSLDKETVRVIQSSPKWTPPRQGGRAVKQLFTIPVIFQLK
jgi:periplasmic protein TonB